MMKFIEEKNCIRVQSKNEKVTVVVDEEDLRRATIILIKDEVHFITKNSEHDQERLNDLLYCLQYSIHFPGVQSELAQEILGLAVENVKNTAAFKY